MNHTQSKSVRRVAIDITWDDARLEQLVPGVCDHASRLRAARSVQREHVTELAAYGLTFVAMAVFLPGRRIVGMQMGQAPDILLDATPAALRGVETAGRTTGGRSALMVIRNGTPATRTRGPTAGKASSLVCRADLVEIHLSLWCASPRISIMEQLKP